MTKWNTYNTNKITDKYLYRFVDFPKLINFLETRSLYFARMDTFMDKLEAIPLASIEQKHISSQTKLKKSERNPSLNKYYEQIIKNVSIENKTHRDDIIKRQKDHFVSCWFLSNYESIGMWELYSKRQGFALRIERKYLQNLVKSAVTKISKPYISTLVAGKVKYIDYINYTPDKHDDSIVKYVAFRKHKGFEHEKEYRFVMFANDYIKRPNELGIGLPLVELIEDLDFDIITDPQIPKFWEDSLFTILKKYKLENRVKESELKSFYDNWA